MAASDLHTYHCYAASGEEQMPDDILVVNLQKAFWKRALKQWHFMRKNADLRNIEECAFLVDLIGVGLHIVLGRNSERLAKISADKSTPSPRRIFEAIVSDGETQAVLDRMHLNEEDLRSRFAEIMDSYEAVRHFGTCKEQDCNNLGFAKVTTLMQDAQMVWQVIIRRTFNKTARVPDYQLDLFHNDFIIE